MNCGRVALDDVDVLIDRVGGAEIPHGLGDALAGRQDVEALVALGAEEVPAALQVADQAVRLVLRRHRDAADAGVERVGQREIDDARLAAEIDGGLGAPVGQLHQPAAAPAREHIGHGVTRQRRGGGYSRASLAGLIACSSELVLRVVGAPPPRCRRTRRNNVDSGGSVSAAEAGKPCDGSCFGDDAAEIAHVRAAVGRRVGVENLAPAAGDGQADAIVEARHRREIADDGDRRVASAPRGAGRRAPIGRRR